MFKTRQDQGSTSGPRQWAVCKDINYEEPVPSIAGTGRHFPRK